MNCQPFAMSYCVCCLQLMPKPLWCQHLELRSWFFLADAKIFLFLSSKSPCFGQNKVFVCFYHVMYWYINPATHTYNHIIEKLSREGRDARVPNMEVLHLHGIYEMFILLFWRAAPKWQCPAAYQWLYTLTNAIFNKSTILTAITSDFKEFKGGVEELELS